MNRERQLTRGQRLAAVVDYLGIDKAHIGCGFPDDALELISVQPKMVASLTLLYAPRNLDPRLEALAERIVCMAGESTADQRREFVSQLFN